MRRNLLLFCTTLQFLACSSKHATAPPVPMETWSLPTRTVPENEIVATVDGAPITVKDLNVRARARGLTPEQALDEAIGDQLVLAQAQTNPPQDVSDAYKAAAASYLIETQFEPANTPANIPDSTLREIYDEIQKRDYSAPPLADKKFTFSHGQWRVTVQLVVQAQDLPDAESASAVESLLLLTRDRYLLSPNTGLDAFRASAWNLFHSFIPVRFEQLPPLSMDADDNLYRLDGEFDPGYLKRIFALPAAGAISDVFPTKHGLHLVFLSSIIPERRASFEDVKEELRSSIGDGHRTQGFEQWLGQLRRNHNVTMPNGRN